MGEHAHPASWRLFRAHPALGLEETDGDQLWKPKSEELGVRWLALEAAEQRRREADLLDGLRRAAGAEGGLELEIVVYRDSATLGVRVDRWKAPALERELLDHVWEEARRRGEQSPTSATLEVRRRGDVARTLRAHVLVAWRRHAWRAFIAAMSLAALLGLHPWGSGGLADAALRIAGGAVVVLILGGLIERWYLRSQRDPQ